MTKFANAPHRLPGTIGTSPVTTTDEVTTTFEGGRSFCRTAASDLFTLAATNMVGEDTFYESADVRDKRYRDLIHEVTATDPAFIAGADPAAGRIGLAEYLRTKLLMRSASVAMACEYVKTGGPRGRSVIDRVCQRPDEPAEVLGYWFANYGRSLPQPVKRGVADAVRRLYNERAALRYDGQSRSIRMGDVIELVHPTPLNARQEALFRFLVDERHHGDGLARAAGETTVIGKGISITRNLLPVLSRSAHLASLPENKRRAALRGLGPLLLFDAGWSWERLSGWLPGGMDAEAWEAIIPSMGAMALTRNLRNFDKAGISESAVDAVIAKITDADEVAKARLFPYHSWQGYREAPSDNWKRALGKTLDLSTANIPALDGTLVAIDCSGSMQQGISGKSKLNSWEVAAVLGASIWRRSKDCKVVIFGHDNKDVTPAKGTSALSLVERISRAVGIGEVGHATYGHTAIRDHWNPARHKRAFLVTDDQQHDSGGVSLGHVPLVYVVNLGGCAQASLPSGSGGRHALAGFGDASFTLVDVIERAGKGNWPF